MNIPITQSKSWQALQNDLNETSFYEENDDYVYLAIKKRTPAGNYLFLPYGPAAENQTAFKKALNSLYTLAKKESAIFIRVEPQTAGAAQILRNKTISVKDKTLKIAKTKDHDPAETWVLDLNRDDLCPSRLLRYYKNREKQGITIETSQNPADIHYLLDLQKALAKQKGISIFSEDYLKTELKQPFSTLYLLKQDQKVLAAGLVFDDEKTRYNLQGAQSDEGRKLHATGILTIQLINDAKEKGLETFDFWGIAPENAPDDHPWKGFTAFKKTFNGTEKIYAGTHDLVLSPSRYRAYKFFRRLKNML